MPSAKLTPEILKNVVEQENLSGKDLEKYIESIFGGKIVFEETDTFCLHPFIDFNSDKYMTMFLLKFGADENV